MRPIRLEVKGFTSFRDAQAVDFEGLDLFGIVGATGSGKSSLLDAMTYALFGEVDRVGKGVSQLVSQGQPRMAVTFEFETAGERYRVTRSTSSSKTGATKILLQERNGGEWRQAGDGADRVRDVNARLRGAIGLDYDAFTRSVLLPQGRFAEFLVGEAKDRREILTELLGLELFKRLARRAGEVRSSAVAHAQAKADLLETEYAGVTHDAVASAGRDARAAAEREEVLAAAARDVAALCARGERAEAEVRELRACATEAHGLAGAAATAAAELRGVADQLGEALEGARAADEGARALEQEAAEAAEARALVEREWGSSRDLLGLRARAEELARRRGEIESIDDETAAAEASRPRAEGEVREAASALAGAEAAREQRRSDARAARDALDRAQHANLVAAVRSGVAVGDPCPVCGSRIDELAAAPPGTTDVADAAKAVEQADADLAAAEEEARRAAREYDAAMARSEEASRSVDRLRRDAERRRGEAAEIESELAAALGRPEDPLAVLDERLARVDHLGRVERATQEAAATAAGLRSAADAAVATLRGRVGEGRAGLAARPAGPLLERAGRLTDGAVARPELPEPDRLPEDPGPLADVADLMAEAFGDVARDLDASATTRGEAGAALLDEAIARIDGLVDAGVETLAELAEAMAHAAREATASSATASERAGRLAERLEASTSLADEVSALRGQAELYSALAKELRADNIIEFLQLEALELLAAGGSERLATLSEGRYRLVFQGEEFFVVDTWNGEEARSARTLSGGETFLASLALALALSDQVQSLATTERARLESLFLDEGFGSLDPETLETVVAAIEQLGGGERIVGVITHVQELAIRLPSRIEVEKSPRGSTVRVVS